MNNSKYKIDSVKVAKFKYVESYNSSYWNGKPREKIDIARVGLNADDYDNYLKYQASEDYKADMDERNPIKKIDSYITSCSSELDIRADIDKFKRMYPNSEFSKRSQDDIYNEIEGLIKTKKRIPTNPMIYLFSTEGLLMSYSEKLDYIKNYRKNFPNDGIFYLSDPGDLRKTQEPGKDANNKTNPLTDENVLNIINYYKFSDDKSFLQYPEYSGLKGYYEEPQIETLRDYFAKDKNNPLNKIEFYKAVGASDKFILSDIENFNNRIMSIGSLGTKLKVDSSQVFLTIHNAMQNLNINNQNSNPFKGQTILSADILRTPDKVAYKHCMPKEGDYKKYDESNMDKIWKIDTMYAKGVIDDNGIKEIEDMMNEINVEIRKLKAIGNLKTEYEKYEKDIMGKVPTPPFTLNGEDIISSSKADRDYFKNDLFATYNKQEEIVKTKKAALLSYKKMLYNLKYVSIMNSDAFIKYKKNMSFEEFASRYDEIDSDIGHKVTSSPFFLVGKIQKFDVSRMSDDEKFLYLYLKDQDNGDTTRAKEFIFHITEKINLQVARDIVNARIMNYKFNLKGKATYDYNHDLWYNFRMDAQNKLFTIAFATQDNIDGMIQNLSSITSDANMTVEDYVKICFLAELQKINPELAKAYGVTEKLTKYAIPVLVALFTAVVSENPKLGVDVFSLLLAATKAGEKIHDRRLQGNSKEVSITLSASEEFSNFIINKIFLKSVGSLLTSSNAKLSLILDVLKTSAAASLSSAEQAAIEHIIEGKTFDLSKLLKEDICLFAKGLFLAFLAKGIGFTIKYTDGRSVKFTNEQIELILRENKEINDLNAAIVKIMGKAIGGKAKDLSTIFSGIIKA